MERTELMKTFLICTLLMVSAIANAQSLNTMVVGNSNPTNVLIVSHKSCKLFAVTGQNLSGGSEYIQVFGTNAAPASGAVPIFSVPVPASPQFYSVDFSYYGADISPGCTVASSSTATSYTATVNTNSTIQAIIRAN
jgi:hypothetical protein